ncbi:uncharacterized protein BDW70DRAFT_115049 [Aspergillus foveolatus]|uniref:uncharacterized protein n=1 Tax=Aspergillus foveolatus TaxID=210207 RepID=UPI003CCD4D9D
MSNPCSKARVMAMALASAPCHCMVVTAAWNTELRSDRCLERVRDRSTAYFVELKNEEMKEANIKKAGQASQVWCLDFGASSTL